MAYILQLAANTFQQLITILLRFVTLNNTQKPLTSKPTTEKMKNILILGGSYAGVNVAHGLLKQLSSSSESFKITLVSPSTHLFWNIAAPRGILPDHIPDEDLFYPIAAGFSQYSTKQFEFIVASAENLDVEQKKVGITGGRVVEYDILVIATGTKIVGDIPLKNLGSTEETRDKVHKYRKRIETAKTIVVAGAGITGVEVAGELGSGYGKVKEIILVSLRRLQGQEIHRD